MHPWTTRAATAALALAAAGLLMVGSGARAGEAGKKVQLFNGKNFDGWYKWLSSEGRKFPNEPEKAKNLDPQNVFTIEDGVIHVRSYSFGYISTEKEYENYRLTLEFKWGEQKYPPRANDKRDAGILYHCVGKDKVWMESLEYQIQEGDCGDMWLTAGAGGKPKLTVKGQKYEGGRVVKFSDHEKPNGEWNKVEVVCKGDTIKHYTNGQLNMEGTEASLSRGKINLQSEGAEIFYRNIVLEPLE